MTQTNLDLEIQRLRVAHGLKPQVQAYPRTVRAISLSDPAYTTLKTLAEEFGLLWNGSGNVSALLEGLGQGIYNVVLNPALVTPGDEAHFQASPSGPTQASQ